MLPAKDWNFVPRDRTDALLYLLSERYNVQIRESRIDVSPYTTPRVELEVEMDIDKLNQLCEDMKKALESSLMNITYTTSTTPFPTLIPSLPPTVTCTQISDGGLSDGRPYIKCTAEQKEKFIQMIERYCDTCFLGNCDPQDEDDCRKCLERRVRWEIE